VPFFLFNTGFIFYFTEEVPPYTPINSNTYKNSDNLDLKINYVVYNIPTKDFFGAMWLSKNKVSAMIYSDFTSRKFLLLPYPIPENNSRFLELIDLNRLGKLPPKGTYIFLRELNTKDNILVLKRNYGNKVVGFDYDTISTSNLTYIFDQKDKIYSNGGTEILS
jgi:hypothetical protein